MYVSHTSTTPEWHAFGDGSWGSSGDPWGLPGVSLGAPGVSLGTPGASQGAPRAIQIRHSARNTRKIRFLNVFERCCGANRASQGVLGGPWGWLAGWGSLEAALGVPGRSLEVIGGGLGGPWDPEGCPWRSSPAPWKVLRGPWWVHEESLDGSLGLPWVVLGTTSKAPETTPQKYVDQMKLSRPP